MYRLQSYLKEAAEFQCKTMEIKVLLFDVVYERGHDRLQIQTKLGGKYDLSKEELKRLCRYVVEKVRSGLGVHNGKALSGISNLYKYFSHIGPAYGITPEPKNLFEDLDKITEILLGCSSPQTTPKGKPTLYTRLKCKAPLLGTEVFFSEKGLTDIYLADQ